MPVSYFLCCFGSEAGLQTQQYNEVFNPSVAVSFTGKGYIEKASAGTWVELKPVALATKEPVMPMDE